MARQTTIEKYGDDYVTDGIITRVWPADFDGILYDDKIYKVGPYGLYQQTRLLEVELTRCESIELYGFAGCTNLQKLTMPACTFINSGSFSNLSALTEIHLPAVEKIWSRAFYGVGISELYLPELIAMESYVFGSCQNLVSADMPKLTSLNIEVFANCKKLRSLHVPSCIAIYRDAIKQTVIERLDLSSIKSVGAGGLANCTSLAEVNLGPNISSIGTNAFSNTKAGIVINLPVAEGVIDGAPWGATDAVINYDHPYLSQYET